MKRVLKYVLIVLALVLLITGYHVYKFLNMREIATDKLVGMSKKEAIDYCFLMQRADERKSGKKLMFIDIDPNGLGYCFYYTDPKEAKSNETLSASCSWKVLFEHESFLWIWIPYSLSLDIDFDNDKVIRAQCGREISWQ